MHLETGVSQVLLEGSSPQIAPGGELLFRRRGGLWAVPFDAERLAVAGTPVPVVASVRSVGPGSVFSIARDGSLAYMSGAIADSSLVWIDRTGKSTPALTARGSFQSPRLSPDGTRVILSVSEEPTGTDLWMYEFVRGTGLRVTTNGRSRRTVWSPDGSGLPSTPRPRQAIRISLSCRPRAVSRLACSNGRGRNTRRAGHRTDGFCSSRSSRRQRRGATSGCFRRARRPSPSSSPASTSAARSSRPTAGTSRMSATNPDGLKSTCSHSRVLDRR